MILVLRNMTRKLPYAFRFIGNPIEIVFIQWDKTQMKLNKKVSINILLVDWSYGLKDERGEAS